MKVQSLSLPALPPSDPKAEVDSHLFSGGNDKLKAQFWGILVGGQKSQFLRTGFGAGEIQGRFTVLSPDGRGLFETRMNSNPISSFPLNHS